MTMSGEEPWLHLSEVDLFRGLIPVTVEQLRSFSTTFQDLVSSDARSERELGADFQARAGDLSGG